MSSTRQSVALEEFEARNSSAEANVATVNPAPLSRRRSARRNEES
jgi:hypothetical protein